MEKKEKKTKNPKVSIIIPVYNGANYLKEAIESALDQTYKNIEIIVVNDGSTDSTEEATKPYVMKIRYFKKENGGVATALNLGIKKAKGEYISWLSHDDLYYPAKIQQQIDILSQLPKDEQKKTILFSNYALIDEKSRVTAEMHFEETHDLTKLNYPLYALLNGIINGLTLLIPKKCFQEIGYYDPALKATQDYDLWFRMFPKYKMIFMPELTAKTRWHSGQVTHQPATFIENDTLWTNMVKNTTDEQKIAIGGSVIGFYQKIYKVVNNAKFVGAAKFVMDRINEYKNQNISKIKVSVIIPFFNRVDWTIEAVKSVLRQTHRNLEIILVDDGSTENIKELNRLIKSDQRIIYFRNSENYGVAKSRNLAIKKVTGEFVAFLDSDDLFYPEKIKTQLSFMVSNGYLFSHTSYETFDTFKKNPKVKMDAGRLDLSYPSIISDCSIDTSTVMLSTDLFQNPINRFPEGMTIGEDACFFILISKQCQLKGLNMVLTKYRIHGRNASWGSKGQLLGFKNIFNFVFENCLDEQSVPELDKQSRQFMRYLKMVYLPKRQLLSYPLSLVNKYIPIRVKLFLKKIW